jgi:nucleoside 2-deoxyribosyltransferase
MNKVYVACPMNIKHRESEANVVKMLRTSGYNVYFPAEFKVEDAWSLPNPVWAKKVFDADIEALNNSDVVVLLYYGPNECAGSAWEAGYAYAMGKRVILVEMMGGIKDSLMIFNGAYSVLRGEHELEQYPLFSAEHKFTNTEQI